MRHDAEEPTPVCQGSKLSVGEISRRLVHGSTARMGDENGVLPRHVESAVKGAGRRMREVEDHPQLRQPLDDPRPELTQTSVVDLSDTVSSQIAPIPRKADDSRSELPVDVGEVRIVAERLRPLHREHQADSRTVVRPNSDEIALRSDREYVVDGDASSGIFAGASGVGDRETIVGPTSNTTTFTGKLKLAG